MRFAVIGAGAVGARAARQLLSTPDVSEVVVRDPRRERLDAVVEALGDGAVADPGRVGARAELVSGSNRRS